MKLPCFGGLPFHARCKYSRLSILTLILAVILIFLIFNFQPWSTSNSSRPTRNLQPINQRVPVVLINWNKTNLNSKESCHFHSCFEVNDCVFDKKDRIRVYVHDQYEFHSTQTLQSYVPEVSREYAEIFDAIRDSRYYERNMSQACVIVPPIDTLNQQQHDVKVVSVLLNSLPGWRDGENHLIFSMLPGSYPEFNNTPDFYYGKAMIASGSFTEATYRHGFDISIPVFNALTHNKKLRKSAEHTSTRHRLLTVLSHGWQSEELTQQINTLAERHKDSVLLLETECEEVSSSQYPWKRCSSALAKVYKYPDILRESRYCILLPGVRKGNPDFMDMLMTGCIPLLTYVNRDYVLPFSDLIDWTRLTVTWLSHDLEGVISVLEGYQKTLELELRMQVFAHYDKYFSSMAAITMATMDVINRRVFPLAKLSEASSHSGLGLDLLSAPKDEGFTAVILTYNRVNSLFQIIRNLGRVRSLSKILVIWNNVSKPPPLVREWPRVKKPIQIIRSKSNKLSNRFYPYPEIKTSAVFSLDDDITMLTTDEIEFAFKAWQEFPNRLVGLPGRVHSELPPDSATTSFLKPSSSKVTGHWKYESSWLNNVSLVLTGAAFYHKYYHFLFTHVMPREIRQWVDKHMNCEDIAMNFLISNHTGLPPLKVTPRKKFKCTSCKSEESLWNDPEHYLERDQCINIFTKFFKGMPLKAVKFRLDPVLFLDPVDDDIKAYPNIGDL